MANNYFSDLGPNFRKTTLKFKPIPAYAYDGTLAGEYKAKKISKAEAAELYESMLVIREFEEMIPSAVPAPTKSSATTNTAARPTCRSGRRRPPPESAQNWRSPTSSPAPTAATATRSPRDSTRSST